MLSLYVDEAGTSAKEPITVVAGVIIHVEAQWGIVEEEINKLLDECVPSELREGFVFHATEIFHCNTQRELWRDGPRE